MRFVRINDEDVYPPWKRHRIAEILSQPGKKVIDVIPNFQIGFD
jgi:hypothetical protein